MAATRQCFLLLCAVMAAVAQQCVINLPDNERRDCHPWEGASQAKCEARGCVWCSSPTNGIPWCFYNDKICPSTIPEGSRTDCMPEGGDRKQCLAKGCLWCETSTGGVPWCFNDPAVSMGGEVCPSGISTHERIDCHPEPGASPEACLGRGCYWCQSGTPDVPWCFKPKSHGYRMVGDPVSTAKGWRVTLDRVNTPSMFGEDINRIQVDVEMQTDTRIRIKIFDPANSRYEVPITIPSPSGQASNPAYTIEFVNSPAFGFRVRRKSNNVALFDTTIGGLTFADQFISIATYLDGSTVYGFGEHEHTTHRHDMNWKTWAMYARDQATTTSNLYGTEPFYMNIEKSFSAHGVFFLNSNAQDVTLTPQPALTYRTIGGILDMYIFVGPSPENVVQQFTEAIGRPVMVPYWSLGFQLCRWGYSNLDHMKAAVGRMRQYNIPHDVQYGDIDYMDGQRDFTIDQVNFAGLPQYVQELKNQGTRFVIILDPAIKYDDPPGSYPPFDRGNAADVWLKTADGVTPAPGEVWPGNTYFPDYFKQSTEDWWIDECIRFKSQLDFAGLWIDMNEPANFVHGSPTGCADNKWNHPPYLPKIADNMYEKTACPDFRQEGYMHYDVHSLYGYSHCEPSLKAAQQATGKRSVVFSRSTFPGAGKYAQHWLGDNFSRWQNLRYSIIGMLEFNMFGFPYVGSDICGFNEVTTEEMCTRWQQLGAFYPFSRNHNGVGNPDQDPGMWAQVGNIARESLLIRYKLLPYLYTLFHHSHLDGSTVVRPLFHEFTSDTVTHDINDQFLWGPAFLISPVLEQGATSVVAYFPNARWYSYYDGVEIAQRQVGIPLSAPIHFIPLHVRGGYILPTQEPSNSTMFSRQNKMGLIVALDDNGNANGDLYWDEGDTKDAYETGQYFSATYSASYALAVGVLTGTVSHNGPNSEVGGLLFGEIRIFGVDLGVGRVEIDGRRLTTFDYDWNLDGVLTINVPDLWVSVNSDFLITWD